MSAYIAPKTVVNDLLVILRAWTGAPLATFGFRKGPQPQKAFRLASGQPGLCFVYLKSLGQGERSAGSGNNWWVDPVIGVDLVVPTAEGADDGTQYDTLLDAIEEFGHCIHDNRTMSDAAKVCRILACEVGLGSFEEPAIQVYHVAAIQLGYKTLRGG